MFNEKFSDWTSQQIAIMVPRNQLESQMNTLKFPITINISGGDSDESVALSFSCPHVVDQIEAPWNALRETKKNLHQTLKQK